MIPTPKEAFEQIRDDELNNTMKKILALTDRETVNTLLFTYANKPSSTQRQIWMPRKYVEQDVYHKNIEEMEKLIGHENTLKIATEFRSNYLYIPQIVTFKKFLKRYIKAHEKVSYVKLAVNLGVSLSIIAQYRETKIKKFDRN